jgi:hypothetical protein
LGFGFNETGSLKLLFAFFPLKGLVKRFLLAVD